MILWSEIMDFNLLFTFIILNIINVILHTVKSLCTTKGSKFIAALSNALAYGLYTVVVIYMVCDLPLFWKVFIVAVCNFIGVYIVKLIEEKATKDKLWRLSITIPKTFLVNLHEDYKNLDIPHSYLEVGKWGIFTVYCENQADTSRAVTIAKKYNAKMFASENKLNL